MLFLVYIFSRGPPSNSVDHLGRIRDESPSVCSVNQCALDAATLGLSDEEAKRIKRDISAEWKLWAEGTGHYCDASRQQNFYGLQDLAFRAVLESGDCVVLTPALPRPGALYR